jgi:hypothetical protein
MTFVRYPFLWLPLLIVFGVLPTILVPFMGFFFAFVWAVVLVVVAFVAVVAAGWKLVAAFRAVARPLWWRWLGFVRASGIDESRSVRFDGSPSLIRRGLLRSPAQRAPAEQRKPETRR